MQRRAFTLIELMISIALVLILIIGINQVFSITSQTVGAGQAHSNIVRDMRAVQQVFVDDFRSYASDGPALIIKCEQMWSFLSARDAQGDRNNQSDNWDVTGSAGSEADQPQTRYNFRSHRLDRIAFFARGLFRRQTGNDGVYVGDQTASEAWIWYGHVRQPDNSWSGPLPGTSDFFSPGAGTAITNPNNFYASQWALGRFALLLIDPSSSTFSGQNYIRSNVDALSPLAVGSVSTTLGGSPQYLLQESRYDIADASISSWAAKLNTLIANDPTENWWSRLMMGPDSRFRATPYIAKPASSFWMSQTAPLLLPSCTQFMVEFAGDFVTQDNDPGSPNYGDVTAAAPDGITDFAIVSNVRRIRFYGMPRDVDGDGAITVAGGDVVPVRDVAGSQYSFEKSDPASNNILGQSSSNWGAVDAMSSNSFYSCAFGPTDPRPRMIRFIVGVDDPNGRLAEGTLHEFVFNLP
jgi:prepilin-type N-terminal cleavage/methylation domain-containing protein